jgi:PAS domain S-box-containing protein
MIWLSDAAGRLVFVNRRLRKLLGCTEGNGLAEGWASFIHPEDRVHCLDRWCKSTTSATQYEVQLRYHHQSGGHKWLLFRAEPMLDRAGKILNWVGDALDMEVYAVRPVLASRTEEDARAITSQLESKVIERTRALQETTEQLNEFVYSVAHDLKAPIRAQAAFAALLLSNYGPLLGEQGRDFAERIVAAAHRQGDLIRDLLSHVGLSRAEFPIMQVDLARTLEQAQMELQIEIQQKQAVMEWLVNDTAVLANPASLQLAVTNLISNAIKFVPRGKRPEVRIRTQKIDGFIRLLVEDNGIGIPAEHRDKVFELFQRLHAREDYPGTGIGLAIVKKAVERMGGRVGLESEPGKGSRFWMDLMTGTDFDPSPKLVRSLTASAPSSTRAQ